MGSEFQSDRIVFFGDSLTDSGTIYAITSEILTVPIPLDSAGYAQVFSNGPVYSQTLPGLLNVPAVENYAVGGAMALGDRTILDLGTATLEPLLKPDADPELLAFGVDLGAQVDRFLADEAADPFAGTTTASILIGLNDLIAFGQGDPANPVQDGLQLVGDIVDATLDAATALAGAGADVVVLYTFPDAGFFPLSQSFDPALAPVADALFAAHQTEIRLGAAALEAQGIDTEIIELDRITDEIAADPQTFGFLSPGPVLFGTGTDPEFGPDGPFFPENPEVAELDPDQIEFFDLLHPTTALHGILASYSAAVLDDRTLFLGDADDARTGGVGDDFALAGAGGDTLWLRGGDDTCFGGLDDDRALGCGGADILAGGSGDDLLAGGDDSDALAGGTGDDCVFGGAGADALIDGLGADRLLGGGGDDALFYADAALIGGATGDAHDFFDGGRGEDTLFLAVTEEGRADAEAAIAAGDGPLGAYEFAALNISVTGVEHVVLTDRTEFGAAPVAPELAGVLHEADLWGLV